MKIVEIKCPSCGGKLKMEGKETKLVTCEYCGNQFLLDDEKKQNITNYNIYQHTPSTSAGKTNSSGNTTPLYIAMAALVVLGGFAAVAALLINKPAQEPDKPILATYATSQPQTQKSLPQTSELYQLLLETFGEELTNITYIKITTTTDQSQILYSFDDPYGASPDIRELILPKATWDGNDFQYFTGLVRLESTYKIPDKTDLSGLTKLQGILTSGMTPSQIAKMVADPAQIKELSLRDPDSMEGITELSELEILSVRNMPDQNLKQLVTLKHLKELSLEDSNSSSSIISNNKQRVEDYSAVSAITSLESLSIHSDLIKDLGFLKGMSQLKSLTIDDTSVINLEPIKELSGLQSLTLIDNSKAKDYESVSLLTGLIELTIDKSSSQPDPDLSALTALERLEISGFMSMTPLKGLIALKDLSIHGCSADNVDVLSSLSGVERLTFYSVWSAGGKLRNLNFIDGMTNLKYANFSGRTGLSSIGSSHHPLEVYGDISSIFNHPGLEELYLNSGMFEINFDRVAENPTLRILELNDIELHKNFHVESYSGITNVWYDDVVFTEHLDFLLKFPNLEELSLMGNELAGLEFIRGLKKISHLNVADNYITDLSALLQAENLRYLNVKDNPVGEVNGFKDSVQIVQ